MRTYARRTSVPVDRSRIEIERLLAKHGADQFLSGWDFDRARIGFRMKGRMIRIELPLLNAGGTKLNDQAMRSRWRALVLVLKAKLEAVNAGIVSFESEFLAQTVMPDNRTIGAHVLPGIAEAYKTGKVPPLLLGSGT